MLCHRFHQVDLRDKFKYTLLSPSGKEVQVTFVHIIVVTLRFHRFNNLKQMVQDVGLRPVS